MDIKRSYSSKSLKYKVDKSKETIKSAPINLPLIKQTDIATALPSYTSILKRTQKDGVRMDDLDQLQQDFERMLSTCAVRIRLLKAETEDRRDKKGKPYQPSAKRKREDERRHTDARNVVKILKTKQAVPVNNYKNDESVRRKVPKVIIEKHDVSNRFWLSLDPYCQDVSRDNVCFLDDIIQECSQEIEVKIPEVGDHYATEWAENTVQREQTNGHMKAPKKPTNSTYSDVKRNGVTNNTNDTYPSPLMQRLLDTLIKEKVIKQMPTVFEKFQKSTEYTIKSSNGMRSGLCLDRLLRKELVDQGILDVEDLPKTYPPDDEILMEIKKCQQELEVVNKHNISELHKLKSLVDKDIRKQDVKAALDKVDTQVLNMYNKLLMMKQNTCYDRHKDRQMEEDAAKLIKEQLLLHEELTELTDFSLFG
ncbi:PREDICTED: transcriptional adapter 3 [Nicrophorus vespilloides]|uniref:Transcriptional adapter 3 n=1 Tax=Nicrophorus vespilloides TaxID=110193 RepID=A0ABM1MR42_NICVS|nr:PREDICTED: transcriptional adapter 3 [Nicrophorus vespilloides]XP_017777043.1 PREDICTED: transcriptional adapter 3 [Nicrophorus vespilloides]